MYIGFVMVYYVHKLESPTDYCTQPIALQMQLRRAAKARISRMVAPKSKRKELTCPDYVRKEWEDGNKNAMADLLQRVNWDKDPF